MKNNIPSSELIIKPASFNDINFIQQLAYETWPVAYKTVLSDEQLKYMLDRFYSRQSLEEQMKNEHYFFLALKDFIQIGFASFSHLHDNTYKLQKLYVKPSEQKNGAGKKLLNAIEDTIIKKGGQIIQLNVNRKNKAIQFYQNQGFSIKREEVIDIGNGYFMNDYVMEKNL